MFTANAPKRTLWRQLMIVSLVICSIVAGVQGARANCSRYAFYGVDPAQHLITLIEHSAGNPPDGLRAAAVYHFEGTGTGSGIASNWRMNEVIRVCPSRSTVGRFRFTLSKLQKNAGSRTLFADLIDITAASSLRTEIAGK